FGDRLRIGVAAGFVSVRLAGIARTGPLFDAGAQYELDRLTIGASLRNLGPALSGDGLADADLPSELRLGATLGVPGPGRFGATIGIDLVGRLAEGGTGVLAGLEAGL